MFEKYKLWTRSFEKKEKAVLRLFCLPYAGGNAEIFLPWRGLISEDIELCPIQLPGRSYRFSEKAIEDTRFLIEQLGEIIKLYGEKPFVFFGHSMGALLSYELSHYLVSEFDLVASRLFISGRSAPSLPIKANYNKLDDDEFIKAIKELNKDNSRFSGAEELLKAMMPTLRADFRISEEYKYIQKGKLNIPITAFGGVNDHFAPFESLYDWRLETALEFKLVKVDGGHFFVTEKTNKIIRGIVTEICNNLDKITAN